MATPVNIGSEIGNFIKIFRDNKYPVYGFGAFPTNMSNQVNHCFPLDPRGHCTGIQGVITAYNSALDQVVPSGPTLLEPVITEYSKMIKNEKVEIEYFILVILTDGDLNDFDKTKKAIMNATELPLSIIIVGIGGDPENKFKILRVIDNNLNLKGKYALRDIVKFVDFSYYEKMLAKNKNEFKKQFAKEVLCEVPDQVREFMGLKNITPDQIHSKVITSGNNVRERIFEKEKLLEKNV